MELRWIIRDAERIYGPYNVPQLAEFILPIHHLKREGADVNEPWTPAYRVPELASLFEPGSDRLFRDLWIVETADGDGLGPISTESMKELIFMGRIRLSDRVRYESWEKARLLRDTSLLSRVKHDPSYGDRLYRVTCHFHVSESRTWSFQRLMVAPRRNAARDAVREKLIHIAGDLPLEIERVTVEEARNAEPYT